MTERFVGPSGSGSTYSRVSPGHCAGAIAASSPDDIIMALSGTYTGADYMVSANNVNGTSGHPITFRADVDGEVLFDGEGARNPVRLENCDYWVIEGINAANSDADVFTIYLSTEIVFRRCGGWNADPDENTQCWLVYVSSQILLEDTFAFGTGRKQYLTFDSSYVTIRRPFGMWNSHNVDWGPMLVYSLHYNADHTVYENPIGTRDEDTGASDPDRYIFGAGRLNEGQSCAVGAGYFGGIAFLLASQNIAGGDGGGLLSMSGIASDIDMKDCVLYVEPGSHEEQRGYLFVQYTPYPGAGQENANCNTDAANSTRRITNVSIIDTTTASPGNVFENPNPNGYTVTNFQESATVTGIYAGGGETLYTGTNGAKVRYRYTSSGPGQTPTLTSIPLWPWPMNQRIIDAMTAAGRTPVDVTATIFGIFGTSPDVTPASDPPVDNFDSYTLTANLDGQNGGTGDWLTAWTNDGGNAMTIETAPAGGQGGKAVRSATGGSGTYHYRTFSNVSTGTFRWEMSSSVTNPNDDQTGVTLHETGVSERCHVQFSSGGNIRAYDFDGAVWVNVLVGFSSSTLYRIELEIDGVLQPDLYRVRVNEGTWTAWIGASGTMDVLNHIQFNNYSTNATIYWDAIGATFTPPAGIPIDDFDSYTAGTDLNGLNGGTRWAGSWTKVSGGAITVETAPAGMVGNAIKSS